MKLLEICASSYESVLAAAKGGADRIELCSVLSKGGVTPSAGLIKMARIAFPGIINVLVRPRPGDFLYSNFEIEEMINDIQFCADERIDGVVIGVLDKYARIDKRLSKKMCKFAKSLGLSTTFHRAIDCTVDSEQYIEDVIQCDFDRILTSGGLPTAEEGKEVIKNMIKRADGRIIIMPGSGINENNIASIAKYTGATEFHMSASKTYDSKMLVIGGIAQSEKVVYSDVKIIKTVRKILREI
ncbi:MAG: copper homeostasis protein CutC [Bacteroidales bacterium]